MPRSRLLLSLLALAGLLVGLLPSVLSAREAARTDVRPAADVVVHLYYGSRERLDTVGARYDIWEVRPKDGYAVVLLSPEEYQTLQTLGYRLVVDEQLTQQVRSQPRIPGFPCYRTVEETDAALQGLAAIYPGLTELGDIGDSWNKLNNPPGYDLYTLRITNEAIPGPKPVFFLMGAIHGREITTGETAVRMAEYVLAHYGTDPDITFLVDYGEIHIAPITNPDAHKIAEQGILRRKNTDNDDGCTDPYLWGVDPNRNFTFMWGCCGGSSGDPCSEAYRGPDRASEPESQALMTYIAGIFPDQNGPNGDDEVPPAAPVTTTGILVTLHSYTERLLWPWGFTNAPAPNAAQLETIGTKLATYNGYLPQQSNTWYSTDGTTDDWSYGKLGIPSFTYEQGNTFYEECSTFEGTIWPNDRASLLYAWKIARTPYQTAYGPDALDVAARPAVVTPGAPAQLAATIDDRQNGGQPLQAAEYYLLPLHGSTPPGEPGSGTPLGPADGSWDDAVEAVVATLDTSALTPGSYVAAVRGQDAEGNWGPFTATFLYVVEPGVAPVIEGYVRAAGTGAPLDAVVRAGLFQASTDPATGSYSMTVVSGTYDVVATAAGFLPATASGVVAHDYEVVQQDLELQVRCAIFSDTVEAGNPGWTADPPWAIVTETAHSPTHSWTDSPGANYGNNVDVAVTSGALDLSSTSGVALDFWHRYATEPAYDFCYVEYSTDGGGSWARAATYTGLEDPQWREESLAIPALDAQPQARVRFRLQSDAGWTADGWHVDDIVLSGAGPMCPAPLPPAADFASNSPVVVGSPVTFTNQTVGFPAPGYSWDFGDGLGTSTATHPVYTYAATGTFTVTLVAANALGRHSVSHPVVVESPCDAVHDAGFSWVPVTPTVGQVITFTSVASGTAPITYSWKLDVGTWQEGPAVTHTYGVTGTYTVVLTATNCGGAATRVEHEVTVVPVPCTPVSVAIFDWFPLAPAVGETIAFTATVQGDTPIEYSWDLGDGQGAAGAAIEHIYTDPGMYTVLLTTTNCAGEGVATASAVVPVSPHDYRIYLPVVFR